jgi:hypothetical protein
MTTEERLDKAERDLARAKRRNYWLLLSVMLLLVLYVLGWSGAPAGNIVLAGPFKHGLTPFEKLGEKDVVENAAADEAGEKVVVANRFILLDDAGEIRAVLGMAGDQPDLVLYNERGKIKASLSEVALLLWTREPIH